MRHSKPRILLGCAVKQPGPDDIGVCCPPCVNLPLSDLGTCHGILLDRSRLMVQEDSTEAKADLAEAEPEAPVAPHEAIQHLQSAKVSSCHLVQCTVAKLHSGQHVLHACQQWCR